MCALVNPTNGSNWSDRTVSASGGLRKSGSSGLPVVRAIIQTFLIGSVQLYHEPGVAPKALPACGPRPVSPASAQPFLYVANQNRDSVQIINTRDNTIAGRILTPFQPAAVAFSPDGARAFIPNTGFNSLLVVNTATNLALANIGLGQATPVAVAVSPNGQRVYVANTESGTVSVLNAATLGLVATVRVGFSPIAVAVRPDSSRVYVANASSNSISVINAANNQVIQTIQEPCVGPVGITVTPAKQAMSPASALRH